MFFLTLNYNSILGEGFGFNTNILETNLINLAVVIFIVISFVGDALKSLLQNRKQTILNNLQEADKRAFEAEEKLAEAKKKLDQSKKKASEIREQAFQTLQQEKNQIIQQIENETKRFEEIKHETIRLQQQKILSQISQHVVSLALTKVRDKLKKSLDFPFQFSVNNFNIVLLTKYKAN